MQPTWCVQPRNHHGRGDHQLGPLLHTYHRPDTNKCVTNMSPAAFLRSPPATSGAVKLFSQSLRSGHGPASCPLRSAGLRLPWFKNRAKNRRHHPRQHAGNTSTRALWAKRRSGSREKKRLADSAVKHLLSKTQHPSFNYV